MTPYLIGWTALIFATISAMYVRGPIYRWLSLSVIFYMIVICTLRGNVGTDTIMYQNIAMNPTLEMGMEPLFRIVIHSLYNLSNNEYTATRSIGLIIGVLFTLSIIKSNRNTSIIILALILPWTFQLSMNTLRIGLAYALILAFTIHLTRTKSFIPFFILAIITPLLHYSSILIIAILSIARSSSPKRLLLLAVISSLSIMAFLAFNQNYINQKIELYSSFEKPSSLSGLFRLLSILILTIGLYLDRTIDPKIRSKMTIITIPLTFAAFIIAQYTYAGLRILDLVTLSIPLIMISFIQKYNLTLGQWSKLSILASLSITICGFYRNFVNSALEYDTTGQASGHLSPFIPYTTIFNIE